MNYPISRVTKPQRVLLVIGCLAFLCPSMDVSAQQIMLRANVDVNDSYVEQLKKGLEKQRADAETRLACRIADISNACELSESQLKKLQVASKGAVNALMVKAKAEVVAQAKANGIEFDPDEEVEEEKDADAEPRVVAGNLNRIAFNVNRLGRVANSSIESQKVWNDSIKKVLNEEQVKQWKSWLANRKAFQTEMAVGNFVAEVDRKLLLSAVQREKLLSHVTEKYGELLRSRTGNRFGGGVFVINQPRNAVASDEDQDAVVKEMLSEDQWSVWKQSFASQLNNRRGVNVIGGVNWNGAAAIEMAIDQAVEADEIPEEDEDK